MRSPWCSLRTHLLMQWKRLEFLTLKILTKEINYQCIHERKATDIIRDRFILNTDGFLCNMFWKKYMDKRCSLFMSLIPRDNILINIFYTIKLSRFMISIPPYMYIYDFRSWRKTNKTEINWNGYFLCWTKTWYA